MARVIITEAPTRTMTGPGRWIDILGVSSFCRQTACAGARVKRCRSAMHPVQAEAPDHRTRRHPRQTQLRRADRRGDEAESAELFRSYAARSTPAERYRYVHTRAVGDLVLW